MGYTTDFFGEFHISPALTEEHRTYLQRFAQTRRMKRNAEITATFPDPAREAVGLPIGVDGAFYVGDDGDSFGQSHTPDVVDYNTAPGNVDSSSFYGTGPDWYTRYLAAQEVAVSAGGAQPGLWCQWTPSEDGTALVWDEGEKFYEYEAWLVYLIDTFLKPWGYTVSGEVEWQGEERDDRGKLAVVDNVVTTKQPKVEWVDA